MVCEHLQALENELIALGVRETFRGAAWSDNCREWVYFDAVLDRPKLRSRFHLASVVGEHVNDDPRSGREAGFVCNQCKDAIMGLHPDDTLGKMIIS